MILLLGVGTGCYTHNLSEAQLTARERFSRQYRCPEQTVMVEELGGGAYRARGCRREVIYRCDPDSFEPQCAPEGAPR